MGSGVLGGVIIGAGVAVIGSAMLLIQNMIRDAFDFFTGDDD